jgi:hypothetical protein
MKRQFAILALSVLLLASCAGMPPSKSMEELRARVDAGVRYGNIIKDNAAQSLQIGQSKGLPEKHPRLLDLKAVDRQMFKAAEKLGPYAEFNRIYNEGGMTKAEWQLAVDSHAQYEAAAKQERAMRTAAALQRLAAGLNQASANINNSTAYAPTYTPPAYTSSPIYTPTFTPRPISPPTTVWNSGGSSSRISGNTIWNSDGSSTRKSGDTYWHSDGSSTRKSGDTYWNSDGSSTRKSGNTYWHSDGSSSRFSGNTIWHSDGTSSRISGNTIYNN